MNEPMTPSVEQNVTLGDPYDPQPEKKFTQTFTFKVLFIAILSLLLLIPSLMISSLGEERKQTATTAENEIASKWGLPQNVTGPVIVIPYYEGEVQKTHYILPKTLNINADIKSQTLYRNIYEAVVYNSGIDIDGTFNIHDLLPSVNRDKILLNEAYVELGISDLRGISKKVQLQLGDKNVDVNDGGSDNNIQLGKSDQPGSEYYNEVNMVESARATHVGKDACVAMTKVDLSEMAQSTSVSFKLHIDLKGSETLNFAPVGEVTKIHVKGDCSTPSFNGNFLPTERNVTDDGFEATWEVISINRPYPQAFSDGQAKEITASQVQVGLRIPVNRFQKTERAIKYALLVIVLTFIAALFSEFKLRRHINVFQYLLIGLALVLFYSLLLSMSEHMAFALAYLIATLMTVGLVTTYLFGVLKVKKQAFIIGAMLLLMYGYIFVLLSLESYALLAGSIGLFIILAVIMHYSLKIRTEDLQ
ncbi:MAG: cell envelope integrity protein CreD [Muribaculaceae bacterium]|nr:cell envelope integrity protein CreD [Muribaculaceae bacterium]